MFLTTLRFDVDGSCADGDERGSASSGNKPAGFAAARLYACEDAAPKYLAWYETTEPPRQSDQRVGHSGWERMSFRLMRDVGDEGIVDAPWLYIVHTDIPDDIVNEYNAWYDEEHLPRLVRVPGVPRARRYAALDGNPRYLTAYELTDPDAFTSPEGLAARKTPWTERMRSLFSNTRRLTCRLEVASTGRPDPRLCLARLLLNSHREG